MSKTKITIAGGGLAGSLMAVYMAKRGYEVHVYERRPDMRRADISAGKSINLALSTRGLRALEKAGLKDAVLANAIPMKGRMMHDEQGNLAYQPYGKEGQHINSVSRGGLNKHLLQLADENPDVHLHFDMKCLDVNLKEGKAKFLDANGKIHDVESDLIIGGDGAFSAVRMRMMKRGRFNYSQTYLEHGYKELTIAPNAEGDFAMDPNCLHIWPRGEYMLIALPNPDKTFTCTLFFPFEGPHSFATLTDEQAVLKFFHAHFADAVPLMPELVKDFFENPTGSLVTVRCYPWVNQKAVLIGDACHAVVPFYGQGMNCAFEDCVVLDECLEQYLPDWDAALDAYQKLRKTNADAIADLALQNFVEMRDLVGDEDFLRQKEVEHALCELYPDLFKSQYEMVTFTNMPYREALEHGAENTRIVKDIIARGYTDRLEDKAFMTELLQKR